MGTRIDHGKAKSRRKARQFGERIDRNTRGTGPSRAWRNMRTEWDGEAFPVVVSRMATPQQTDSKMLSNLDQGQETA